mmetsp:Transcript_9048/g.13554  ORF Transcript_9048/g.13554 Transcript_9048/m.13554 type:complete len:222 (+) Transcript_9048:36-701(+)
MEFDEIMAAWALRHLVGSPAPHGMAPFLNGVPPSPDQEEMGKESQVEYGDATPEEELRIDPVNGKAYRKIDFVNFYKGSLSEWNGAKKLSVEKRIDKADGNLYTQAEFRSFYGGDAQWNESKSEISEYEVKHVERFQLSQEMLEMLAQTRKRRLERKRAEAKREKVEEQKRNQLVEESVDYGTEERNAEIKALETELNFRFTESLDSIRYEVHPWPITPLN